MCGQVLSLARREHCPVTPVGTVTGDGRVVVADADGSTPFDLPLSLVRPRLPLPLPPLHPHNLPSASTHTSSCLTPFFDP